MALQCLSFFLDELSPALILPCAIRGLELGEDPDGSACFNLVMAILSSVDSKDSMDGLSLATLECVCRRGSFYCQPGSRVKGAVRACLGLCRSIMKGMISWGPPEDVFFRLELEAARAADADADSAVDNAAVARVLAHLAHGSIAVRLEARLLDPGSIGRARVNTGVMQAFCRGTRAHPRTLHARVHVCVVRDDDGGEAGAWGSSRVCPFPRVGRVL